MPFVVVESVDPGRIPFKAVSGRYTKRGNAERAQIVRQYHNPGRVVRIMDMDTHAVIAPKPGERWG